VAQLRAEITALADRLAGRPVQRLPIGGHDAPMGAVAVKSAHVRARSKTEDLAFRAYEMVSSSRLLPAALRASWVAAAAYGCARVGGAVPSSLNAVWLCLLPAG
jgi:hypothetical protein